MSNFEWYRSFVAIYKEGSLSRAAESRFMTQPAMSQHLAALETAIGKTLFKRTARQMVPTERGKELYTEIAHSVNRLERVTSDLGESRIHPTIRLGGPVEYIHHKLLRSLDHLPYRLNINFGRSKELLDLLKEGKLDVVIATQHIPLQGLQYVRLDTERFHLVGKTQLREEFSSKGKSEIRQFLKQQDWISYGVELPIIRRFWMEVFSERPSLIPKVIVPDLRVIKSLIEQGVGISVLPDYLIQQELAEHSLNELWAPPQDILNEIWYVYRVAERNDNKIMPFIEQSLQKYKGDVFSD